MEKKNTKNIHEGHRARLASTAVKAGLDAMSNVQIVEFFLTYIFPRGDVNPLAHRLLDKFENFTNIVEADMNDLMTIDGINERSARMIVLYKELFYYFLTAKMGKKIKVDCKADIINVVEDYLRFRTTEQMVLLAISAGNVITHRRTISENNVGKVSLPIMELTNFLVTSKPASLVVAHCHPHAKSTPSDSDVKGFEIIKSLCKTCGVRVLDAYIVGDDGVYSQAEEKLVRRYLDLEELADTFQTILS